MTTRLYLQGSGTPAATPAFSAGWNSAASAAVRPMRTALTVGSGTTNSTDTSLTETSATAGYNRAKRQHISDEVLPTAMTVGGSGNTLTVVLAGLESNAAADAYLQVRAKIVSSDGSTVRGMLYDGQTATVVSATSTDPNYEFGTSLATRVLTVATNAVSALAGDRIVVELGYVACNTVTTSYGAQFRINDQSSTDMAATVDGTDYASARCYVEFSDTIFTGPRVSRVHAEALVSPVPTLQVSRVHLDALVNPVSTIQVSRVHVEVLVADAPPGAASATGSLSFGGTVGGSAAEGGITGSLALSGTAAAAVGGSSATATGSLALSAAAAARAAASVAGSVSLSAAAGATAPGVVAGSIGVSGAAGAGTPSGAAGSVTLGAAASPGASPGVAAGSLALSATAGARAVTIPSGALSLSGSVDASQPVMPAGGLSLLMGADGGAALISTGSLGLVLAADIQGVYDNQASGSLDLSGAAGGVTPLVLGGSLVLDGGVNAQVLLGAASGHLALTSQVTTVAPVVVDGSLMLVMGGTSEASINGVLELVVGVHPVVTYDALVYDPVSGFLLPANVEGYWDLSTLVLVDVEGYWDQSTQTYHLVDTPFDLM